MNEKVDERWICVGWSSGSPASPSRLSPHLYTGTKGPGLSLSSSVGLSWESTGHALNRRRQTASLILNLCQVLLLLLLSRFSCVRLCAALQTAAHQASPSLGFSRQEYWSGLPFPSPMHGSEKWKWSHSVVSDSQRPHRLQPTGSSVHGIFQARVREWGPIAFSLCQVRGDQKMTQNTNNLTCILLLLLFSLLRHVWLFVTPWTAALQAFLISTLSTVCPASCPLSKWCYLTISSSATPFSFCPQSFPALRSFPMSQLFTQMRATWRRKRWQPWAVRTMSCLGLCHSHYLGNFHFTRPFSFHV